ncbi:MAG: GntR family transcriptional regulator [Candidatus Omnitrophota bacterium]
MKVLTKKSRLGYNMIVKIKSRPAKYLYLQIYHSLKQQIEKGKLVKGEIIPSEYALADKFRVSRVTIRQALLKLQREKYLVRKRGYGTEISYSPEVKRDEKAIAVMLVDITRPFFAEILKGIQGKLDQEGYKLILCDTENSSEKERDYFSKYTGSVAGFIVAPATGNQNHAYYGGLLAEKIPFVFVDRHLPEFNVDAVLSDNVQGGYLATKYLLDLGHKQIAVLSEPEATSLSERIDGYKKARLEYGLPENENLIFRGEKRGGPAGYHFIREVIENRPEVTAAFCLNDDIAWGALKRLAEMKINIPQDFSVLGFDNLDFTSNLYPSLTTVNQLKYQMGEKAADILLGQITGKLTNKKVVFSFPVELVVRESTGKARVRTLAKTQTVLRGEICAGP